MQKNKILVAFHNSGKPNEDPDSYHPINLNKMAKVLNKFIDERFRWDLGKQFCFKPNYSTIHLVQKVAEIILSRFQVKKKTQLLFLDSVQNLQHGIKNYYTY